MSNNLKAHLFLFLANLIYGINYTIAKDVMPQYIGPSGFVLLRVIGATLLFWLIGTSIKSEKIEKEDLKRFILCGFFGVAANQILFFEGLNLTTPINASIIMITTPILVLIIASWLIKEKITKNKMAGIFLGISGAVTLIILKPGEIGFFNSKNSLGDLFIFLNAAFYAFYLAMAKPLMKKYNTLTVIKWVFLFGLIMVIPFGFKQFNAIVWQDIPPNIWYAITFVVVCTTFLAYLFNNVALKLVSPSVVSAYIYLQPILGSAVALWMGKDSLDWLKVIAAVLIFTGVYLVSKPTKLIGE